MAELSAKQIMEFSKKTGVALMECKKALVQANGNEDEAVKILREKVLQPQLKRLRELLQKVW